MRATAIVPIKRFGAAKQRLSDVLAPADRATLVAAMLVDVLAALARCDRIERTLVVSSEPSIVPTVGEAGAELVPDPGSGGHSGAALAGIAHAGDATAVALLPGDCPLLDPAEVDGALAALSPPIAVVVPDRHGSGTNGLLLAPPTAIAPAFGPGSRERHLELARRAGVAAEVGELASLRLDLDTGEDLARLRALAAAGELAGLETGRALAALAGGEVAPGSRHR